MIEGRLFYVVGACGVGKNNLFDYARRQLGDTHPIMFAHRYITRRSPSGASNEVALSEAEFALRKRHKLLVMDWVSRGIRYGIGNEVNYWLATGLSVVVKGSRSHLGEALKVYPDMTAIWVAAVPGDAAMHAPGHASSSDAALEAHADRAYAVTAAGAGRRMVYISNNGSLTPAGKKLVAALVGETEHPAGFDVPAGG